MCPPLVSQLFPVASFGSPKQQRFQQQSNSLPRSGTMSSSSDCPAPVDIHKMSPMILPYPITDCGSASTLFEAPSAFLSEDMTGVSVAGSDSTKTDMMGKSFISTVSPNSFFVPPPGLTPLSTKNFLTLRHCNVPQILSLISQALYHKGNPKATTDLNGKTLALLFTKRSTRTRVSSESAWAHFGGHPMFLGMNDIQVGGGESWNDTGIVIGSMVEAILCRCGAHSEIEQLAQRSRAPVINALTDTYHPLQILADLVTLYEMFPDKLVHVEGLPMPLLNLKIAWVGDGNNILHSLLVTLPRLGIDFSAAVPKGYEPDPEILQFARDHSLNGSKADMYPYTLGKFQFSHDPIGAVSDADVVVTDTWVSMGQETEKAQRLKSFEGYQVTESLLTHAKESCKFMHCLPRKVEEVDDEVFYGPRSVVWQEAENRKWSVMAVFEAVVGWSKGV